MNKLAPVLLLAASLSGATSGAQNAKPTEIVFCQLPVPEIRLKMSGTFSVAVEFSLDERGRPTDLGEVSPPVVGLSDIRNCLDQWTLAGARTGERLRAEFTWKHEIGWTSLQVSGAGLDTTLRISGERCPYG